MSGPSGVAAGKRRERETLDLIIALKPILSWLISARKATPAEDQRGIDIVITTLRGTLFAQVKSDPRAMRRWFGKYGARIGHKTLQVLWKGDCVVEPIDMAGELTTIYTALAQRETRIVSRHRLRRFDCA